MTLFQIIKTKAKITHDFITFELFWLQKCHCPPKPISKTILVIRLDAIGDSIIWLDQAKEYRKAFPEHKIILLHNKVWTDIANRLTWFDECVPFDWSKIGNRKYYKELLTTLNKYSYEKVYSPVFSRDFITVDWLVHNVIAQEKIGYEGDYQNNRGRVHLNLFVNNNYDRLHLKEKADKWYTQLVPNDNKCIMELQRNAHFIRQTINPDFKSALPSIPFNIPSPDFIPTNEYAVFFIGASTELRTWPVNKFNLIEQHISYKTILLCGSSDDSLLAQKYLYQIIL